MRTDESGDVMTIDGRTYGRVGSNRGGVFGENGSDCDDGGSSSSGEGMVLSQRKLSERSVDGAAQ
jgi:hypothetical protein